MSDWRDNPVLAKPEPVVTQAPPRQRIFVFGSNLSGIHGAGAALYARQHHGAVLGVGVGRTGQAYALPTKGQNTARPGQRAVLPVLPLQQISVHANLFRLYAQDHPQLEFQLTAVGCGYAGYSAAQIAPLFARCPPNVLMPPEWRDQLSALPDQRFWEAP